MSAQSMDSSGGKSGKSFWIMIVALALIFISAAVARTTHTSGGAVKIHDIGYVTEDGAYMRALLYVPDTATPSNPAPAVVSCHGFNNTAEVQDLNCVELSKRGYVVLAIDAYGHGDSTFPDMNVNNGIADDLGTYSALQYLARLPYVDLARVGMVGHSMGGTTIQAGALRAFQEKADNPDVVTPIAILPTAQSFSLDADGNSIFKDIPVNLGAVYAQFDEWALGMWNTVKGSDVNTTPKAGAGMGMTGFQYNTYYSFGNATPLDRAGAVEAAKNKTLRIIVQPTTTHPGVHFDDFAVSGIVDFFDITLKDGQTAIPSTQLTWFSKQTATGISMAAFFIFVTALGLWLLDFPWFSSIIQPEPAGLSTITDSASRTRYWLIYILGLLPAPLLWNYLCGYPIDILGSGRRVPILMPATETFPLPAVNGVFLLNIVVGAIMLIMYFAVFYGISVKAGLTFKNTGLPLSGKNIGKAAILAALVFMAGYATLALCDYFFKTDFRFFTFSIKPLTAAKWAIYVRYLPSFLFFFLIASMSLNTFTRINNRSELVNIILIVFASVGGLFVLYLLDYVSLKQTGIKMFEFIPFSDGKTTAALAGVLLWGLLVILPIAAVISRIFFRKTGSIWVGGFVNALIVTLYAISNTVIAARVI